MRFTVPDGSWSSLTGDTPRHLTIALDDPPGRVQQAIVGLDLPDGGQLVADLFVDPAREADSGFRLLEPVLERLELVP